MSTMRPMRLPLTLPAASARRFDVVGCGVNTVDLLVVVAAHPAPDTKQPATRMVYLPGGQAATAMAACARLGLRARYVGHFGDDTHGADGRRSLDAEGVDTTACRTITGAANGLSVILVDATSGTRTVLWSRDPRLTMSSADVSDEEVCAGRTLLVDAHDAGAAAAAAQAARRAGVPTLIDVEHVRPGVDVLLSHIDVIITAQGFPGALTGQDAPGAALRAIHDRYRPAAVCMTLGAEGSLTLIGDREIRTPGFRVPVVDSTGAGDVFRGGFIAGWLRGGETTPIEDILRYANAAAALKCRGLGGRLAIPRPADVDALLRGERPAEAAAPPC